MESNRSVTVTMAEQDNDNLEHVQGRWKTGDSDNVVVEADQVWMLGDSEVCGTLSVDLVDKEPVRCLDLECVDSNCCNMFAATSLSGIANNII